MKATDIRKGDRVLWRNQEMVVLDPEPFWKKGSSWQSDYRSITKTNCVLLGVTESTRNKTVASLASIRPISAAPLVAAEAALRDAEMRARWVRRPEAAVFELLLQGNTDEAVVRVEKWRQEYGAAEAIVNSARAEAERLKAGGLG